MRFTAAGPPGSTTVPSGAKYSCCASMTTSAALSTVTPSRLAVPVREVPQVRVPARDVGGLQPVRGAGHDVAPDDRDHHQVGDEVVVHLDEERRTLHRI